MSINECSLISTPYTFSKIDKNIGHKAVQLNKPKLQRKTNQDETEFKELKKSTKL